MISHIPAPHSVTYTDKKNNTTEVTIEPCYPGYGITLGNALRRVLLSSLSGAAVTAISIDGVQHEYDAIEHVKEDIVQIMTNLKKLRMTCHSNEPVTLELSAKGEKVVTAADIKKNADVEVSNKDLVIATLTDKKASFSMRITVQKGVGYEPVEERVVEKKEIGTIQIDALYSPIQNIGFRIENVRVGQRTDYEKVVLTITTAGTMSARDAVMQAIEILQEQFSAVQTASSGSVKSKKAAAEESADEPEEAAS